MTLEEVDEFALLGSSKKDVDSFMYWVDGCMTKLRSREGKSFDFYGRRLIHAFFSFQFDEKQQKFPWVIFDSFNINDGTWRFHLIQEYTPYDMDAQRKFVFMLERLLEVSISIWNDSLPIHTWGLHIPWKNKWS